MLRPAHDLIKAMRAKYGDLPQITEFSDQVNSRKVVSRNVSGA